MAHQIIYIMGVSGSGKSTIGHLLSDHWGIPFYDGDDFHPEANVNKMKSGEALTDEDREGWLESIQIFAANHLQNSSLIIACSALKNKYRSRLEKGMLGSCKWVYLKGSYDLIAQRLKHRSSHFMPSTLLQSQFDTLEEPKDAITIDIAANTATIISEITSLITMQKAAFGLAGLGVMGKSLARNLGRQSFTLALYNRHLDQVEENVAKDFIQAHDELSGAYGFDDLKGFVESLSQPRKIFMMVPAGEATQQLIDALMPFLDPGDLIMDGGNAHYLDTEKRSHTLKENGILYLGCGVSGGEKGALEGPSVMPGGASEAYELAQPILESIAARDFQGSPCCAHIGSGGAGHFVKMVHNGIEYGEMQLLAEVYGILKHGSNWSPERIAALLESWMSDEIRSYLLEITIDILRKKENEEYLLEQILDRAGNKGTGSWTTKAACDYGRAIPTITAALFARYQSSFKTERSLLEEDIVIPIQPIEFSDEKLRDAYQLARVLNHLQGFQLIQAASEKHGWNIQLSGLARIWTNGCIIRSALMETFSEDLSDYEVLMQHPSLQKSIREGGRALLALVGASLNSRVPVPCFSASANFMLQSYQKESTAHVIQAQRDYFGAHTYQRRDDPEGGAHHTQWTD